MGESQIGFMNIFARPLFQNVTEILPAMQFSVDELKNNKSIWEGKIEEEKEKKIRALDPRLRNITMDLDHPSPMTRSTDDLPSQARQDSHSRSEPFIPKLPPLTPAVTRLEPASSKRSSMQTATPPSAHPPTSRSPSLDPMSPASTDTVPKRWSNAGVEPPLNAISPSRRGSGDASLTAIIVTSSPSIASDRRSNKEAGCSPRLRSLSPKKRTSKSSPSPDHNIESETILLPMSKSGLDYPEPGDVARSPYTDPILQQRREEITLYHQNLSELYTPSHALSDTHLATVQENGGANGAFHGALIGSPESGEGPAAASPGFPTGGPVGDSLDSRRNKGGFGLGKFWKKKFKAPEREVSRAESGA